MRKECRKVLHKSVRKEEISNVNSVKWVDGEKRLSVDKLLKWIVVQMGNIEIPSTSVLNIYSNFISPRDHIHTLCRLDPNLGGSWQSYSIREKSLKIGEWRVTLCQIMGVNNANETLNFSMYLINFRYN